MLDEFCQKEASLAAKAMKRILCNDEIFSLAEEKGLLRSFLEKSEESLNI